MQNRSTPIEILLVEDNPGDQELTKEMLEAAKIANNITVAEDGVEALATLRKQNGTKTDFDLVLLDLNLPRKDGRAVLEEMKRDPLLKTVPVIVLTSSTAEQDVLRSYRLHANCYISKPVQLESFAKVIAAIDDFWLTVVRLPRSRQCA